MGDRKNAKDLGGMAFVGFLFIGLALGMLYYNVAVGVLAGLGAGFIAMALVQMKCR